MTDYNWWDSEEKVGYSEALRDARSNGDGFVPVPHFEPTWGTGPASWTSSATYRWWTGNCSGASSRTTS